MASYKNFNFDVFTGELNKHSHLRMRVTLVTDFQPSAEYPNKTVASATVTFVDGEYPQHTFPCEFVGERSKVLNRKNARAAAEYAIFEIAEAETSNA